jgi:glycine cleavage system pyridoxal-binding protein P
VIDDKIFCRKTILFFHIFLLNTMRYLALTNSDRQAMLQEIGVDSVNQLYCDVDDKFLLKQHRLANYFL